MRKLFILGTIIVAIILLVTQTDLLPISAKNQSGLISPVIEIIETSSKTDAALAAENTSPPSTISEPLFQNIVDKYPEIDISIALTHISQNKTSYHNKERINIGASTTKLFAASTFLSQLEKGKQNYDIPLGSFNAKFQLEQLVKQSNNTSWTLFYNLLGTKTIENYIHSIGSATFDINENQLRAEDMTIYLTKLYKKELHSEETTQYLLSLMQNTNEETFLPSNTNGYTLYHKNGQLEDVVNEAILAIKGESALAIGIYTDGKGKWEYTQRRELFKELIGEILKG